MAKGLTRTRASRVEEEGTAERLLKKSVKAFESALDAVADDPEAALERAGVVVGKFLDTVGKARDAYANDPEAAKRKIRNVAVGAAAEALGGRKKRTRK